MASRVDMKYLTLLKDRDIGSGSFGDVYLARWKTDDEEKTIAVKEMILVGEEEKKENKQKIENEVNLLWKANHENIVKCFGFSEDNSNHFYILMEYADCGSLFDLLHKKKKTMNFSFRAIQNWMLQCAKGMVYLHDQKILHRDLKTQNLLLTDKYQTLKIGDFGTVKKIKTMLTSPNTLYAGTIQYTAPEAFQYDNYDEKCDVYSFGIVLWEVMSRKKPYSEFDLHPFALSKNIMEGTRPDLDKVKPYDKSKHMKLLIEMCWNEEPRNRPTMRKLALILGIDSESLIPYNPYTLCKLNPLPKATEVDIRLSGS